MALEDTINSGDVPDYMYAADVHQVANGKSSVLDSQTWADEGSDFGKFALSTTARALTSAFNTVPAVANWFGADFEEAQTESVIAAFDNDLASYYSANRDSIDVVGDAIAMFVPGMAGVKGINYAQKGLAAINKGTGVGRNLARSFGTLPELGSATAKQAQLAMAETGRTFKILDGNVLKAFAANYGQGAVEMAAFEVAASSVMSNSPLFEDHSAKDILFNAALGGGFGGAGIMGSVAAAQTYGQLRRAGDVIDKALAPFKFAKSSEEGVDGFAKILLLRKERDSFVVPQEVSTDAAIIKTQTRNLEKRQRDLNLEIQETFTKMAGGDSELGSIMARNLDQMAPDASWAAMLKLQGVSRMGTQSKLELDSLAAAIKGKPDDTVVKYLRVWGEDAGAVYNTAPGRIGLPDLAANAKELSRDIERRVSTQPVMGNAFSPVGHSHLDVEARYLAAFDTTIPPLSNIASKDLPYLEAALQQKVAVTVDGVYMDTASLRNHIKSTKLSLADELQDALALDPTMNTAVASKLLNVKQSVLEGKGYPANSDDHFFAMQSAVGDELALLRQPSTVKVVYKGDKASVGVDGNELSGMIQIKAMQEVQRKTNEQAAAAVLGEDFERLIKIRDELILDASSRGAGAGIFSMASGEYGTLGSIVENIGKVTNEAKSKAHKAINDTFQPAMHAVLQSPKAQNEVFVMRQAALQSGEKYVLSERDGMRKMVLQEVDDFERKVIAGKNPIEPNYEAFKKAGIPVELPIQTDEAWNLMTTLVGHNSAHIGKEKLLRNAVGKGMGNWDGVVYFPQPSSKNFPYFSFVQPKNPFDGEKIQMVWARSPEELAKVEASIPLEYRIIRKQDTDRYYKAIKEYDYDLGMNSRDFVQELKRKGTAAPFVPKTNAQELFGDVLEHYKLSSDRQIRDAVSLHNNVAFSELRRMDSEFKAVRGSKKNGRGEEIGVTPYESYIKTALDIPRSSSVPVWTELNNLAEGVVTKVFNTIKNTFRDPKTPEEMAALNAHFDDAGFRGVKDALTELVANHPADKRVLSNFVQSANGLFSTLILRTDPMNALNNAGGNLVLTGSETNFLTRLIRGKGGAEAESFLRELSEVKLPGSEAYIKSPTKLISRAYGEFFSMLRGENVESVAKMQRFKSNGWMPEMVDQLKASMDSMTLTGLESTAEISGKIKFAMASTGRFLERATGNSFAESMNRFVAAHIADDIAQAGIKYAGLDTREANAFINTFVNRTQGNYVASQRPLMFQGPIGQSISLFMTYQFNMMQHIFRHMSSEGGRKNAAVLMGLQTSIYGMNGLPAFNFLNERLVGNASGNTSHRDVHSTLLDVPAVGDWLLYGGLSNATGLGLYSRGDMNPRHLTVVPTSISDVPFISATVGFFGSMGNAAMQVMDGANPASAFLRGIEHAGISRPLAGLAEVLNGVNRGDETVYSTSKKGNVVYAQDLYSLATLGRVAGARPLEEAITRDAYYRVQVYDAQNKAKVNSIGAAIRDKVQSKDDITDEDVHSFMENYVKAGGNQKNFVQFYQSQIKAAGKNQVAKLVERGNSSGGQYMQQLMNSIDSVPQSLE